MPTQVTFAYGFNCISPPSNLDYQAQDAGYSGIIDWLNRSEHQDCTDVAEMMESIPEFPQGRFLGAYADWDDIGVDFSVSFCKAKLPDGTPVFMITESGINHVFVPSNS